MKLVDDHVACARPGCDAKDYGERVGAMERGWLIVSPDRSIPVFCGLHAGELADGRQVFGPEYERYGSRVPVDGDLLITETGLYDRHRGEWVLIETVVAA